MYESGMTHQEIADVVSERIGEPVTRVSVTLALSRAGVKPRTVRYDAEIPWTVQSRSLNETPVRMLRILARKTRGKAVKDADWDRCNRWLEWLKAHNAVVAYCPERRPSFVYVTADEVDDWPGGIPVRPRVMKADEFEDEAA